MGGIKKRVGFRRTVSRSLIRGKERGERNAAMATDRKKATKKKAGRSFGDARPPVSARCLRWCFGCACMLKDHEIPKCYVEGEARAGVGTTERPSCRFYPAGSKYIFKKEQRIAALLILEFRTLLQGSIQK